MEGRVQSFNAVVKPLGDSRPAWKVLRMLGATLGFKGAFEAETLDAVRHAIAPDLAAWARAGLGNAVSGTAAAASAPAGRFERIAEYPIYGGDPVVRRSPSLQKTADALGAHQARLSPAAFAALGLAEGQSVKVRQGGGEALVPAVADASVPEGCVRLARGIRETAGLGEGEVTLEKAEAQRAA